MAIQRVDGCNEYHDITYRLVADWGTFSGNYAVAKPSLMV